MYYFDILIYCNLITIEAIFITLHHYSTELLTIFIILFIRFLWLIYYSLQLCTLNQYYLPPTSLAGNQHFTLPLCMYITFFLIHSSVDNHLSCFHSLAAIHQIFIDTYHVRDTLLCAIYINSFNFYNNSWM